MKKFKINDKVRIKVHKDLIIDDLFMDCYNKLGIIKITNSTAYGVLIDYFAKTKAKWFFKEHELELVENDWNQETL